VDPSMSVQSRLTVPVGSDLSTCMVQGYGGWFTGSRALRLELSVSDRTRADSRNILRPLKPLRASGTTGL
jgi:hypothetical protein